MDDTGRKPFLFWGALSFTACLVLLAIGFAGEWPTLSLMACWGLVAAYALSFGPVTWLVTAEMFPAGVRGKALGIGQVMQHNNLRNTNCTVLSAGCPIPPNV